MSIFNVVSGAHVGGVHVAYKLGRVINGRMSNSVFPLVPLSSSVSLAIRVASSFLWVVVVFLVVVLAVLVSVFVYVGCGAF